MSVVLRVATPADLDAMFRLDCLCFDARFRFSRTLLRRLAFAPDSLAVVAEADVALIGMAILTAASGEARSLATLDVHPQHRRAGVAASLLRECGCRLGAVPVTLEVYVENEPAVAFYERLGYVRRGRLQDYYGLGLDAWSYEGVLACGSFSV